MSDTQKDDLYDDAVAIVKKENKASISFIQRYFRIGYNRSARLIEQMENDGVISKIKSDGTRTVLKS